jgi:hypothetical protein
MKDINNLFFKNCVITIEGVSRTITSASAYISRSGQSVAVTLHGPIHDHPQWGPMEVIKPRRIYLSLADCQYATEPKHLINLASHKARSWMDDARAELWHHLTIDACRPLRDKCRPILSAISSWCRNTYGSQYWRNPQARAAMRDELSRIGVTCPPEGPVLDFLCLTENAEDLRRRAEVKP